MYLNSLGEKASAAKYEVQILDTETKNRALEAVAEAA